MKRIKEGFIGLSLTILPFWAVFEICNRIFPSKPIASFIITGIYFVIYMNFMNDIIMHLDKHLEEN
jgi:hypothetical protein